ncbi:MAG: N-acetylneuraminate synthase [Deltaproteobacteria bacterium]|nr:N-acetylneuraminate synthase [Deltaproteobacteria bacterium]
MTREVVVGGCPIGDGRAAHIIAEIGINHNGDLEIARKLIDAAVLAGANAVKFQKRTPELCVPPEQRDILRETPWGLITYMEYRHKVEFGEDEYAEIDRHCKERGIPWFASSWDEPSVEFMERFDPVCHKVASACLNDDNLLRAINATGRPVILSTGMSTPEQIRHAVSLIERERLLLAHCTSTYPCGIGELNLRMIQTLKAEFECPVGYSGHEVGLPPSYAAVALGANFVERHITLDRAMWGTDQAASVEPWGFMRLVRDIRVIEQAMGDGVKKVYESELPLINKLRLNR